MGDDTTKSENRTWTLDRRLPVGTIVTLALQMLVFAWGASKLDSRVSNLELQGATDSRIAVIETKLTGIATTQTELKTTASTIQNTLGDVQRDVSALVAIQGLQAREVAP